MKTIAFINNKGGVGKTASVTSVAHMLATRYNKKVLVVDTDPQMNTTMMFSNVDFVSIFNKIYKGGMENTAKNIETLLLDRNVDIHDCTCCQDSGYDFCIHG